MAFDRRNPAEVVKPDGLNLRVFVADGLAGRRAHVDRHVAQAHHPHGRMAQQRLGNHAGRIGKVNQPRVRTARRHASGDVHHHRDGAQALEETADARGFLSDESERGRNALVQMARGQLAYANLRHDERRLVQRVVQIHGQPHPELFVHVRRHALRQRADNAQFPLVNVHEHQLFHRQNLAPAQDSVHQLRRIGAARADYRHLKHPQRPLVSFCKTVRLFRKSPVRPMAAARIWSRPSAGRTPSCCRRFLRA